MSKERVRLLNKMPYELRYKLRQYNNANIRAKMLYREVEDLLGKYDVPSENLSASVNFGGGEPTTEGLAFINNCEGDIEDNIAEIEEVFLYFVNKD
jgi:sulfatase maturation enzyme AslB (radical SAM superfamily)